LSESGEPLEPLDAFDTITEELRLFDSDLGQREQIVVLTKLDLISDLSEMDLVRSKFQARGQELVCISSVANKGLESLLAIIQERLLYTKRAA